MRRFIGLAFFVVALISPFARGQVLTPAEAKAHLGESATVCGLIATENTAINSQGKPTFLNLDQPYPHQIFTVLVWEADRTAVGAIPKTGRICANGTISLYRGVPEIVAHSSSELYVPKLSNDRHYTNSDGQTVHSPAYSNGGPPAGATALCRDSTYSFSQHRQGTCSHHGGVAKWLP
jgi:hypothetical protein